MGRTKRREKNCRLRPFRLRSVGHPMTDDEVVAHGSVYGCADISSAPPSPPGKMATLNLEPPLAGRWHARRRCSLLGEDDRNKKLGAQFERMLEKGRKLRRDLYSDTIINLASVCLSLYKLVKKGKKWTQCVKKKP